MASILWLQPAKGYSERMASVVYNAARTAGIKHSDIFGFNIHNKVKGIRRVKAKTKDKMELDPYKAEQAKDELRKLIKVSRCKVIAINDEAMLWIIAEGQYSLDLARGSVYYFDEIPCIPIGDFTSMIAASTGQFEMQNHLRKLRRWAEGKQRAEPKFNLKICQTVEEVKDLQARAEKSPLIAIDCETSGNFMTCIGYTIMHEDRSLWSYVIPFYNPFKNSGAYWDTFEEECLVWEAVRELHGNKVPKVLQNGSYDLHYFIPYGAPLRNYFFDTLVMHHSIWCEAKKKLNYMAGLHLDYARYWKDESKGFKEDSWGKSQDSIQRYWRYNALDCHNTFLVCIYLASVLLKLPWARKNYEDKLPFVLGPCLAASLRGMRVDLERHEIIMSNLEEQQYKAQKDLEIMVDDRNFKPTASAQVATVLYDILKCKPTRLQWRDVTAKGAKKYGPRSTDEKVLKLVKEQGNIIANMIIDQVLDTKKPGNNLSKYGNKYDMFAHGRFYYKLEGCGTETDRCAGKESNFWVGTNPQNIPAIMREMLVADKDYVYVDIDYEASDDCFIGFESLDPIKLKIIKENLDPHCYCASIVFKRSYEELVKGKKNKEEWVVHPHKGVRNIQKKVSHGKNFGMQATTLYNTMGRDMVVAVAVLLGHEKADTYDDKQLIEICKIISDAYDDPKIGVFKRIRPWQSETLSATLDNNNLYTNPFGRSRLFLGNLRHDGDVQRELFANVGQGDTAGNINRVMTALFFPKSGKPIDDGKTVLFLLQVHDSLVFAVHKDHLHKIDQIVELMEEETEIKGHMRKVRASAEVGITWGKNMLEWKSDMTYEEILAYEKTKIAPKYKKLTDEEQFSKLKELINGQ